MIRAGSVAEQQAYLLRQAERVAQTGSWRLELETGRITWSEGMYRIFGIDVDAFMGDGAGVPDLAIGTTVRDQMERITASLVKDSVPVSSEFRTILPDGRIRWVYAEGAEETAGDGRVGALVGYVQDVTRRKAYEDELQRRETQLEGLLEERGRNLEQLSQSLSSLINVVCMVVEKRDPYTAGHERRVSELAVDISEALGLSAPDIEEIRVAALIHDVGKISVPTEILTKPDALSPVEFELVKLHVEVGHTIMAKANMTGWIAEMVYQHHERCDGTGYPRGLSAQSLLPGSKILMVADVVEAMTSHRPYRPALGVDLALLEIERGAGSHYDTEVCTACEGLFENGFAFSEA